MIAVSTRAVAGDDDDLRRIGLGAQLLERLEAVHLRHHDVEQRDVEGLVAQRLNRRLAVADAHDVMAAAAQKRRENLREILFVFGDEHANAARGRGRGVHRRVDHAAFAGKRMRKTLPSPTALSTSMRPPCSVTIA